MPLSAANMFPGGPIKSADAIEYFNLLTGAMTDQPVTLANTLTAGGSHGAGSVPFRVNGVAAQTANMQEVRALGTDVNPIFAIGPDGTLKWGPGGGVATDTTLRRSGVGILQVSAINLTGAAPTLIFPSSSAGPNKTITLVTDNGAGPSEIWTNTVGGAPASCIVRFDVANGSAGAKTTPLVLDGRCIATIGGNVSGGGLIIDANSVAPVAGATQISLSSNTGTTIGANGAASALTANPAGYWIINVKGNVQRIPYYN